MRKIIPYIIKLSIVLMAVSVIGQHVNATKSDVERALELLKQARAAIGGESTINSVQSLSIQGRSSRQIQLPDQGQKQLTGEFELNMMLPDKLIRMEKLMLGAPDAKLHSEAGEGKQIKIRDMKVKIIRDGEDSGEQNARLHHERSEIARYMLGLLLTPPPSFTATYIYAGEGAVEGARADIIEAQGANGFVMKIYLDKSSHLPLMMSYQGTLPRIPLEHAIKGDGAFETEDGENVVIVRRHKNGESTEKAPIVFERKINDGSVPSEGRKFIMAAPANGEIQVRFSDFRSVGGVLLPHILTHMVNGQVDTVWTVGQYEINSPSINEKFRKDFHWQAKQN